MVDKHLCSVFRNKLLTEMEDNLRRRLSLKQQVDFEEIFKRIVDDKKELCDKSCPKVDLKKREERKDGSAYKTALFKELLMACCDSCQKRAKIMEEENLEIDQEEMEALCDENAFECSDQDKDAIHEILANMFFTKVILPGMNYVENFADFLIDAELNNLPVLKRVCEGYLCSELNTV
ncbi:hypothetical protein X798_06242, partial [Onchocerca flexuosa]